MVKPYFKEELGKTLASIRELSKNADLVFPLVADSHLSDNGENTRENISAIDAECSFPFLVHLGDFLNGNNPERISRKNLREEVAAYRACIKSGKMLAAQGNHDGYRDESYAGQLVTDIALDENWYEDTGDTDTLCGIIREGSKPYFYRDIPELSLRMIFLCTNGYEHDRERKIFKKSYSISEEQIDWLGKTALDTPKKYTVMVFSHIAPLTVGKEPDGPKHIYGKSQANHEKAVALLQAYKNGERTEVDGKTYDYTGKEGSVAAWFFGHHHSDCLTEWQGLMCVGITSQTAYVPQLWRPLDVFPGPRDMGTVREDAWDTVIWNKAERKITIIRFGCGEDRELFY